MPTYSVPDLPIDSTCEAPPNFHLHDWRKMEVCLINFNKGEDGKPQTLKRKTVQLSILVY
jgi:hypothetical protein